MNITSINQSINNNNIVSPIKFNGKDTNSNCENKNSTVDVLRKQLMNLAVASMILVNATACSPLDDEPLPDKFVTQCPKVELPIKSMSGLDTKASLLFQNIGLLLKGVSVMQLDEINVTDKKGNQMLYKTKEANEDKITMDYTIIKPDGSKASSTYEISDNKNGGIKCVMNRADGVKYSYNTYTQYSYDFNDLYQWSSDTKDASYAIIRKGKNGTIKRINEDNSVELYKVSSKLK